MSRWIAGVLDPRGCVNAAVVPTALASMNPTTHSSGPLQLAYSGPSATSTGPLCLFDGYLDNAEELRRELGAGRAGPATAACPEELMAAAYRHWGVGLLGRMRGDFALLVWDSERGEGLLARDQLGVRPWFLHETGGVLRFANEVRHLLKLLPSRPAPDPASVAHLIGLSSRPGIETLYSRVHRLGPGEILTFGRRRTTRRRYWIPRYEEPRLQSGEQLAQQICSELKRSTSRRISGKGKTGVLMSGGLDSGSIAALCGASGGSEIVAFSGTFPEHPLADEAVMIDELADKLDLPSMVAEVRPGGLVASTLEHLAAWQMPLLGWGDFWTLPLMRTAAEQGVETMLDGDGGDELFGPRVYLLADRLRACHPAQMLRLARDLPGAGPTVTRRQEARVIGSLALVGAMPYRVHSLSRKLSARYRLPRWLRSQTASDLIASDDPFAWKRLDGPRWWADAAYAVSYGIEQAGVFEHQRRRADLAGLESRHPMLDLDLVQLCLRQQPEESLDHRFSRPVLRAAMAGLLPDSVRLRPAKARFESLIISCLRGPDGPAVRAILMTPKAELGAYIDLAKMREALFETDILLRREPFRWMWQVWRLLNTELWLRSQSSTFGLLEANLTPSNARVAIRSR